MNQQDFLQECSKSHLEVLAALGYFRGVVQERCDHVVDKHIAVLAGILGVKVDDLKWSPYADPDKPSPVGVENASLGWKAKRQEDLYLYFTVNWDSGADQGESPLNVLVDFWLKDKEKATSLAARLDDLCNDPAFADQPWEFGSDSHTLSFWMDFDQSEFLRFDEKLDQLLAFVIPFLKSVKGIQKYFLP